MVKLSRIFEALQYVSGLKHVYYLLDNDEIFTYDPFLQDEFELEELEEHDYIVMPSQHDINERRMMINYAYTLDDNLQDRLLNVLHKKGAYSNFKQILTYNGIIKKWYLYRDNCYIKLAKEILEDNDIDYINDMEDNLCEICHKNVATITRDGKPICEKCNNKLINENVTFVCPEKVSVTINKRQMVFNLSMVMLPNIVLWTANSVKDDYEVRMYSKLDSDLEREYEDFIKKIKDEIGFKSLDGRYLKSRGNIEVTYDGFIIDGIKFRPEELHRLLSSHEGYVLEYKLEKKAGFHLTEDEYLVKKRITENIVISDFRCQVNDYIDDKKIGKVRVNYIIDFMNLWEDIRILREYHKDISHIIDELISIASNLEDKDDYINGVLRILNNVKENM